jgi:hypothetical protein
MPNELLPFTHTFGPGGGSFTIPAVPGYLIRLRGVLITSSPNGAAQLTGPNIITMSGFADNLPGGNGTVIVTVPTSETDVYNLPLEFGEQGVEAAGPNLPIEITPDATGEVSGVGDNTWLTFVVWGNLIQTEE